MKEYQSSFGYTTQSHERLENAAKAGIYDLFVQCVEEVAKEEKRHEDVNWDNKWGEPWLIAAAIDGGNSDILNYVLDHSRPDCLTDYCYNNSRGGDLDYSVEHERDPLHYAIRTRNAAAVATLLERQEILDRLGSADGDGNTALHHAVKVATDEPHISDASIIESLAEQYKKHNISQNSENDDGETALDIVHNAIGDLSEGNALESDGDDELYESLSSGNSDDEDLDHEEDLYEGEYLTPEAQFKAIKQIKQILEEHGALTSKVAREAVRLGESVKNPSNLGAASSPGPQSQAKGRGTVS